MIEVQNICPINKGNLLAMCDVHIVPWKMTLKEIKIFQKGANRWIAMPSREFVNDNNEKKYIELIAFDNDSIKNRFRGQIMEAVDKFIESNPNLEVEPVIKMSEDIPF